MHPTVHELLNDRDNNFNLIRFLAALAVIYDHSYTVLLGDSHGWVLPYISNGDLGWYAVNVFFILSGFLVTKSWLRRGEFISYAVARSVRLLPGLGVAAFAVAFIIGPIVCLCLHEEYFSDLRTWSYVPLTASLISPTQTLPFVFEALPKDAIINNPLWTLRYEALSYAALGAFGMLGLLSTRTRSFITVFTLLSAYLIVTTATDLRDHSPFLDSLMRFWLCFFLGALVFLVGDRITLRPSIIILLLAAATLSYGTSLYELVLQVALAYGLFWVALVPDGTVRRFNQFGDYSYGLYIYAWPFQQIVVLVSPDISPLGLFSIVTPIVLLTAMASWHWIESPALNARHGLTDWVSAICNDLRSTARRYSRGC